MNKEKLLFIAYTACRGKNFLRGRNPDQYLKSIALISSIFLIHVAQIIALMHPSLFLKKPSSPVIYFILVIICMFFYYLIGKIFSKKILARAIKTYSGSSLSSNAVIIAFGYLIFNFVILAIIFGIRV